MDLSPIIAWLVPLAGILASAAYGVRCAATERPSFWGAALATAILLGVVLTFLQVVLHQVCIDAHFCEYRGDGNMSYWFQSFFAIPVFWLVAGTAWQLRR
ncbi:hypothetical protein [Caldimonas brevitalea]|uniref:hypothetical protein n=1 Tax=Caldimonas brevitalea TaxID=413882 RepID=UPI0012FC4CAD|nr:hypothetical protein [Caldimonas brevitalea]